MFPQRLDAPEAYAIARALMHGFNLYYRMFNAVAANAKQRFESMDWQSQQQAQRERIELYDLQVRASIERLEGEFATSQQSMAVWQQGEDLCRRRCRARRRPCSDGDGGRPSRGAGDPGLSGAENDAASLTTNPAPQRSMRASFYAVGSVCHSIFTSLKIKSSLRTGSYYAI